METYSILSNDNFLKILIGRTINEISVADGEMILEIDNGFRLKFYHEQDCCESVNIESIDGDVNDLLNTPLLMCEEVTNIPEDELPTPKEGVWYDDSQTWTFYKFATVKGYVTVRWLGESNGYYSESVDIELMMEQEMEDGHIDDNWMYIDGYISHYNKTKEIDDITFYFGYNSVMAKKDNTYAHGKDSHAALVDLKFKLAGRNKNQYRYYTLKTVLEYDDAVIMYRIITGACQFGTQRFLETNKIKVKPYSIKEIIDLTQGQFGSKAFVLFFSKRLNE